MLMMMMTTRSSMRVKPPSRSSRALRIRASIALPPERMSEPRGAGSPRGLRMESGRGSPADPLLGPVALRPRLTTGVLLLALRLDDDQVIGQTLVRLEPVSALNRVLSRSERGRAIRRDRAGAAGPRDGGERRRLRRLQ